MREITIWEMFVRRHLIATQWEKSLGMRWFAYNSNKHFQVTKWKKPAANGGTDKVLSTRELPWDTKDNLQPKTQAPCVIHDGNQKSQSVAFEWCSDEKKSSNSLRRDIWEKFRDTRKTTYELEHKLPCRITRTPGEHFSLNKTNSKRHNFFLFWDTKKKTYKP